MEPTMLETIASTLEEADFSDLENLDLPWEDGIPLDSNWQRAQIDLLIRLISYFWRERSDFYAGGNMFVYFSPARRKSEDVKGPDFFVVKGVPKERVRKSWIVWEEGGKYPDLIIELLPASTAEADKTTKKSLYEQTFRTPEYFWYDPTSHTATGWQLVRGVYTPITPDERGWLWSQELELWLGNWSGYSDNGEWNTWLRFYDRDGQLVPTRGEAETAARLAAEAQAQAAEAHVQAAEARAQIEAEARAAAEAEIARLRAELERRQRD
jgi:Uma2 family endonuclease